MSAQELTHEMLEERALKNHEAGASRSFVLCSGKTVIAALEAFLADLLRF